VTTDPMFAKPSSNGAQLPSPDMSFPGSSVVQLVNGDAHHPDAMVVEINRATVTVTDRHVSAGDGDQAWSWLLADLEEVVHSPVEPWTILVVPGINEFGVSVPIDRVGEFRTVLDTRLARHQAQERVAVASAPALPPLTIAASDAPLPSPELAALANTPMGQVPVGAAAASAAATGSKGGRLFGRGKRGKETLDGVSAVSLSTSADVGLAGLDARHISAWFGTHQVLDRVSLHMEAGKVTSLIGPSGCGKSTFLRILNRMHEMIPSASMAGEVLLEGHDIYDPNRKLTDARREIGMVFQKPNPFPAMSIYDNVVASLQLTGTKASTSMKDELVESCLSKAGLWNEVKDRLRAPGGGLSGGQQQRLCIARALAIKPRVLLMDEPCSALDPTSTRRIEETIIELASEVTIVIVTHNMQQAARVSDYCAFFLATQGTPGVIIEHGPTDAMFGSPQDQRTLDYVTGRFG